jgi:hypothetical protein
MEQHSWARRVLPSRASELRITAAVIALPATSRIFLLKQWARNFELEAALETLDGCHTHRRPLAEQEVLLF